MQNIFRKFLESELFESKMYLDNKNVQLATLDTGHVNLNLVFTTSSYYIKDYTLRECYVFKMLLPLTSVYAGKVIVKLFFL